ncbi:gluconate 2-dehydrogenase subunit 3 family protein [Psychroflexus sp. CAK1W]|uniref:gluconate 2-dehydrogenase subunit 3 family protein n=1 Tax=Psychroflexus curvus TaxID=2873595 RepID=UPI001CCCCA78|nr:gluconate 2-dehydrogenase subunit 3 family protein [Psychroflexus curvus]MBZ9626584.1 gluconate 2-dehydrogenase subunit 3 family protein [Psychroflexus curvus]
MKRREALKNIGFATGFLVVTPTIISILQSCDSDIKNWKPIFFTVEQGVVLTRLADVILPKTTKLPSATDLNVPQFIDRYANEVLDNESQNNMKIAFDKIIYILKANEEISINDITDNEYKALLDKHLVLSDGINPEKDENPSLTTSSKSEFLNYIKWMCITAYLTTEEIGENVLVYDPIPTKYYTGDLQELTGGISYSL